MILIPAMELAEGQVVKAGTGKPVKAVPTALVKTLRKQGAVYFHLQDRDGKNAEVMKRLAEDVVAFQVGGPGCKPEAVREMLGAGADRVVVPASELESAGLKKLAGEFGVRVLAEVDVAQDPKEQLAGLAETGLRQVVLKPEGGRIGDPELLVKALEGIELDVFSWSSIEGREDFAALRKLVGAGLRGAIIDHTQCAKLVELAQAASA